MRARARPPEYAADLTDRPGSSGPTGCHLRWNS